MPGRRVLRPRRRVSVVGVIGELLITGGVVVLLFIAWQLWFYDGIVGGELKEQATQQAQEWNEHAAANPTTTPGDPNEPSTEEPPVQAVPAAAEQFGMLIVPRWGADYYRPIAEGVGVSAVLNKGLLGHYPTTQMPGELGNFALAAHRTTKGGSLHHIHELQLGDNIYVETAAGWYRYSFRNLEYVRPTGVGVLDPVPQDPTAIPGERYITLTSCNPIISSIERIIAYGVYDGFFPRDTSKPANGAPEEIAATVMGTVDS
ncbi:MAG: class E sortase [Microbacteriaceae bacterium]|nr:MAG: class E sortase [Microbacteriaceae bacterium]